jgi:hypothetical protein
MDLLFTNVKVSDSDWQHDPSLDVKKQKTGPDCSGTGLLSLYEGSFACPLIPTDHGNRYILCTTVKTIKKTRRQESSCLLAFTTLVRLGFKPFDSPGTESREARAK